MKNARTETQECPTRTILYLCSFFFTHSASSMPSCAIRSGVMVEADAAPFRPNVLPEPRWSHCTTVKDFSQLRNAAYPQGFFESPVPPCKKHSPRFLRYSPRFVIPRP